MFLQVYAICSSFVSRVMFSLVEHVMDEISRLFQCVAEFSRNGALQVRVVIFISNLSLPFKDDNSFSQMF